MVTNNEGEPQLWDLEGIGSATVDPITRAIRYHLHAEGFTAANTQAELNAVRAAFDQWASVPGGNIRFQEGSPVYGPVDVNTADGTNVVFWAKDTLVNDGRDSIAGRLAVAFTSSVNNVISEGDIVFNGAQFDWFADYLNPEEEGQFIESTALHEIGHLLGLSHSPAGGATMFPRGARGVNVQAGLSADEISAVHALYSSLQNSTTGRIEGVVAINGSGVFGAVVTLENAVS
ncbi:MAG: matrixin family metalloprotease, partial [Verrucomicrobiales bacterium]